MTESADVERRVREVIREEEAQKHAEASRITCGTVFGAAILGGIPIAGGLWGIWHLTQGRSDKGWLFIGMAVAWFAVGFILAAGSY